MQHLLLWPDNQHAAHLCVLGSQSQSAEGIKHCCAIGPRTACAVTCVREYDPHVRYARQAAPKAGPRH